MDVEEKDPAAVSLGRKGGLARAQSLTAQQRKRIAAKASKAAAVARTKRAKQKKETNK
jgi:hypothetical protein